MKRLKQVSLFTLRGLLICLSTVASAHHFANAGWDGVWSTPAAASPIEATVARGVPFEIHAEGKAIIVTASEVSPDRHVIFFSWDGGEGSLRRIDETTAEISLFGKGMAYRAIPLVRKP